MLMGCGRRGGAGAEESSMPSLTINTNADLGTSDVKNALMTKLTQVVAKGLGKPDSYVAIQINDKQTMMWGGSDEACALCQVASLGAINQKNNSAVSRDVAAVLADAPFGIKSSRVYVEFRDVKAENMGYNGATFAG